MQQNQMDTNQNDDSMAIEIRQIIDSAFSFIIYTMNPVNHDHNQVCIKVAIGTPETLVPGSQAGTPYKLVYNKTSKECSILSFSNHSNGYFYNNSKIVERPIDYSQVPFTHDHESLKRLGAELGRIACEIENGFGGNPH